MSLALASGDAGGADTGLDRREQRGVHSSTNKNLRQVKRADPQRVEKSNHFGKGDLQLVRRAWPTAGKDSDRTRSRTRTRTTKFKMSVSMTVMTFKGIGGRLNKITATGLDVVLCVFREEGQGCAQKEGDVRGDDLSKEVQALEGRHLHLLRGQRRSDREREGRDEGFGDHETM